MTSACATHPGLVRKNNEDCIRTDDNLGIYLLADGIGGHNAGEVASALAIETAYEILRSNIDHTPADGCFELIVHAMHTAHWEISTKAHASESCAKMGTTLVVAVVRDNKAYIVHAGDSRCYLLQSGAGSSSNTLKQITRDHTVGNQQLESGISIGQIPKKKFNILTRSVGCGDPPYPDFNVVDFNRGDMLLLCSDGLTDMLTDDEIKAIFATGVADLDTLVVDLVDAANLNGGRDNISVVVVASP